MSSAGKGGGGNKKKSLRHLSLFFRATLSDLKSRNYNLRKGNTKSFPWMGRNCMTESKRLLAVALGFLLTISADVNAETASADYLTLTERELVEEMNLARTHPRQYAEYLVDLRQYYHGDLIDVPGKIAIQIHEGLAGIDEAIRFLRTVQPAPALIPSAGMSRAARDHVQDQGAAGLLGHRGTDGYRPGTRLNRYGEWLSRIAENIAYGQREVRRIIINQIVDDGIRNRGHRTNLFNAEFRKVGVACGEHATYRWMCVMELAVDYSER